MARRCARRSSAATAAGSATASCHTKTAQQPPTRSENVGRPRSLEDKGARHQQGLVCGCVSLLAGDWQGKGDIKAVLESADLKQQISQRRKEAGCKLAPSNSVHGCCSKCSVLLRCEVLQRVKQQ